MQATGDSHGKGDKDVPSGVSRCVCSDVLDTYMGKTTTTMVINPSHDHCFPPKKEDALLFHEKDVIRSDRYTDTLFICI